MDNDERRKIIIDYVAKNQGCTIESIVDDLEGIIARPTIYNILPELIKDGAIIDEKPKPNSRNHKLFVNTNNPLVSVPRKLEEFKSYYLPLVDKATEKTRARKTDARLTRDLLAGVIDIFNMLTSVYLFHSTINWPRIIRDKETLNRLNIIMLTKLVEIQSNLSQKLLPSMGVVYTYNILSNISGWRIIKHDPIFKKFNLEKEKSQVIEKIGLEQLYGDPEHGVLPS